MNFSSFHFLFLVYPCHLLTIQAKDVQMYQLESQSLFGHKSSTRLLLLKQRLFAYKLPQRVLSFFFISTIWSNLNL